jgi:hypothetical protein
MGALPAVRAAAGAAARAALAAPLLFTAYYLLVLGTWRWRDSAAWERFPPRFGCDDRKLLDSCTARQARAAFAFS